MGILIGLNGAMGSGKTEAHKTLCSLYPDQTKNVKFAQPLYDMQEMIYDRIKSVHVRPPTFVKDRRLLQWLGTEWGRDTISKSIWIDIWKVEVRKALAEGFIVTCDDVRFENETTSFKEMGGVLINIQTNRNGERITTTNGIANHASEAPLDPKYFDYIVENNGTLEEFRAKLSGLFTDIILRRSQQPR